MCQTAATTIITTPIMCQTLATKKRSRSQVTTMDTLTKRAKQIELQPPHKPCSPVDVAQSLVDSEEVALSLERLPVLVSNDLNLEVKLMQGAVNDMQDTVNLAAVRINELRDLLTQYAQRR